MKYKILYTKQTNQGIKVKVMAFATGQLIEFTLDELDKDNLDNDLKQYILGEMDKIKGNQYRYDL